MLADHVEHYENDGVGLEVHYFEDRSTYWIKSGVGYLQFEEDDFLNLIELTSAYKAEEMDYTPNIFRVIKTALTSAYGIGLWVVLIAIVIIIIGGFVDFQ